MVQRPRYSKSSLEQTTADVLHASRIQGGVRTDYGTQDVTLDPYVVYEASNAEPGAAERGLIRKETEDRVSSSVPSDQVFAQLVFSQISILSDKIDQVMKKIVDLESRLSLGEGDVPAVIDDEALVEIRTTDAESLLASLESCDILIPEPELVRDYLLQHPDMADALKYVCEVARDTTKDDAQLSLELYSDPEISYRYLTLYVRQASYDNDILDSIKEIGSKCAHRLVGKSGRLLVTTDFEDPR